MANSAFIMLSPFTVVGNVTVGGTLTMTGQLLLADGSAATPSLAFNSQSTTGFWFQGSNTVGFGASGNAIIGFDGNGIGLLSTGRVAWMNNSSSPFSTADTSLSRPASAGVVAIGTGASGSFAGTVKATTINATTTFQLNGANGVATFGASDATSFTVAGGILTAIS